METPTFTHDCAACQFLGKYKRSEWDDRAPDDLYYCPKTDGGTVLARYGDDGPEYTSCPIPILLYAGYPYEHPLLEATRRQIKRWQEKE